MPRIFSGGALLAAAAALQQAQKAAENVNWDLRATALQYVMRQWLSGSAPLAATQYNTVTDAITKCVRYKHGPGVIRLSTLQGALCQLGNKANAGQRIQVELFGKLHELMKAKGCIQMVSVTKKANRQVVKISSLVSEMTAAAPPWCSAVDTLG